jgi:hypothetical protein
MAKYCFWITASPDSPQTRLSLQFCCTTRTPDAGYLASPTSPYFERRYVSVDNIIAALERRHRVSQILLGHTSSWHLENVLEAVQGPFPELIELVLYRDRDL